jgi:hypothetical protein
VRVLPTELVDPRFGLRRTAAFVCEDRLCRVHVQDDGATEPTLANAPLYGPRPDAAEIRLGEAFQVDGQSGTFRLERLSGEASALTLNRLS